MFLLACLQLENPRAHSNHATATALRRVGADVVVIVNCSHAAGQRIKRDSRYRYWESVNTPAGGVVCLSDRKMRSRSLEGISGAAFGVTLGGGETALIGIAEQPVDLAETLSSIPIDGPTALIGHYRENLDDVTTRGLLLGRQVSDVHGIDPFDKNPRHFGIVVAGLRIHGDGVYASESSAPIHWARLSY